MSSKKKKTKAKAKKKVVKKKKTKATRKPKVSAVPAGYGTVTASLIVNGAAETIAFCKAAFGAKLKGPALEGPNGLIVHAVMKIGDSLVHVGEAMQTFVSTSSVMLYVKNADKVMEQALAAGAEVVMPLENMFWGDRYGVVKDPKGNQWEIATHVEDVAPATMKKLGKAMMLELAKSGQRGG